MCWQIGLHLVNILILPLLLIGCTVYSPFANTTPSPDRIATRVAEEKAVAATLTVDARLYDTSPTAVVVRLEDGMAMNWAITIYGNGRIDVEVPRTTPEPRKPISTAELDDLISMATSDF